MTHRFFVESPVHSDRATLSGTEAHHLRNVLRAAAGDEVVLFDGTGHEYRARIQQVSRSQVELRILDSQIVDRELARRLVIGVALPKGERQRWLVEKLVEVGACQLVPLSTVRSIVQPSASTLARLRRVVIEASKQCGRNRLMEIQSPLALADYVAAAPFDARRWLAVPGADRISGTKSGAGNANAVYLLIGPEGGLTDDEQDLAVRAGWQPVSLGERILRIETAALVAATLAAHDLL